MRAAYLGAGMDSVAFDVNDTWVFRFPMRQVVEQMLFVERAVLPAIAPMLPVAVPAFTFFGRPDADIAFHFAGYAKLPGTPAVEMDPSRVAFDAIAAQLGRFLSAVHRFPVSEAKRLGAQTSRIQDHFVEVRESALADLDLVRRIAPEAPIDRLRRYLEDLRPLPEAPWPMTLTHHDLAAEHVLLDAAGATVTGVIDWGDVNIADPTVDFVGLYAWGGAPFVRSVLTNYEGLLDERVIERVRPWAAFRAIQDIRFGVDNNIPEVVRLGIRALTTA